MLDSPVRVALLARPGEARDQLRKALTELGAQLVAEGDPAELEPAVVAGEKPTVVLVSLEPALEDSLERFEDLLATPGIEVMYDDAEVTRLLDGWDLARWARHLACKLVGADLLPPAPGGSDQLPDLELSLEPGAPPTPAQEMAHARLEDYAAESLDLSEWVPSTPSLAHEPVETPVQEAPLEPDDAPLDLDLGDLELAMGRLDAGVDGATDLLPRGTAPAEDNLDFDANDLDIDLSAMPEEGAPMRTAHQDDELSLADEDEPLLADLQLSDEPISFSSFSDEDAPAASGVDDDVAALAAQLDAYETKDHGQVAEPDFSSRRDDAPAPAAAAGSAAPAAAAPPSFGSSFGSLELMPMDDSAVLAPEPVQPKSSSGKVKELAGHLSLADAEATRNNATSRGALLLIAGLGGPDAVRQLLSALPPTLPVPVLLYQHLDTGKHDRLVGQLAKASGLPLDLATEGKLAFPGRVAVLQPGVGISLSEDSFHFIRVVHLANVVEALPAADSGVLVLSGADPSVMPAVLALQAAGALVLAQDPASCFDAAAAQTVIASGAAAASPAELAKRVIERWN